MASESLDSMLQSASDERLLKLAAARIDRNDGILAPSRPMPQGYGVVITSEMRRYISAWEQWLRDPTPENRKIRKAALMALLVAQR